MSGVPSSSYSVVKYETHADNDHSATIVAVFEELADAVHYIRQHEGEGLDDKTSDTTSSPPTRIRCDAA